MALFCGIHEKYVMWKFIVDVVHDFVSSLQPDVGRGFLHVSNVFLYNFFKEIGKVQGVTFYFHLCVIVLQYHI